MPSLLCRLACDTIGPVLDETSDGVVGGMMGAPGTVDIPVVDEDRYLVSSVSDPKSTRDALPVFVSEANNCCC